MSGPSGNDLFVAELLRGSLDHCVKCTICETACPVSNATPLFPGPKYEGPQSERYRIADEPSVDASVDYCSGCGICSLDPGITETPMQRELRSREFPDRERFIRVYEEGTSRNPDDVAAAIGELSLRDPRSLNGKTLRVGAL